MLSPDENQRLTQVGAETPMGRLLRRYWMPIAAASELSERPTQGVRLMGEDLVLYRDASGVLGLIDRVCAHRGADLSYGTPEKCGLRCMYHGWRYDQTGQCVEAPFEDTVRPKARFRDKVRLKSYPVATRGGLVWAYLGPQPAPELWDWDAYHRRAYAQISFSEVPCNWLQLQENSIDPVHFEWLHTNWVIAQRGSRRYGPTHTKIDFDEFEFGFIYRRLLAGASEDEGMWKTGRVCLWPNCLYVGSFGWRVPIDDARTLLVTLMIDSVPGTAPYEQQRIPSWHAPTVDPATGRFLTGFVNQQDIVAAAGQGTVVDRSREHLGESDRGVILLRRRLTDDLEAVAAGRDPSAILRDASRNHQIPLPFQEDPRGAGTLLGAAGVAPDRLRPLPGQPQQIIDEMTEVFTRHRP